MDYHRLISTADDDARPRADARLETAHHRRTLAETRRPGLLLRAVARLRATRRPHRTVAGRDASTPCATEPQEPARA